MSKHAPKVFISYSHDNVEHKKWVAALGVRLRENGVDAILDQWDLFPGEDIPAFMEKQLSECDFAILVCTKRYVEKANSGTGGVGYEKMIVTSELVKNMEISKFIPVIRQSGTHEVPKFIETKLFINFSKDSEFEVVFDELLRTIYRSSVSTKPPLGSVPSFKDGHKVVSKDSVDLPSHALVVFAFIARQYDSGQSSYWNSGRLIEFGMTGKLSIEAAFSILLAKGYLELDSDGDYVLSDFGKTEAIELDLV